jgi:magnesium transporter
MKRFTTQLGEKAGMEPGSLVYVGNKRRRPSNISVVDYDLKTFSHREVKHITDTFPSRNNHKNSWINIEGSLDSDSMEAFGKYFRIHSIVLENILHMDQRPKLEDMESHIFVSLKILFFDKKSNETRSEQLSLIVFSKTLITFEERPSDIISQVRKQLSNKKGRMRKMGAGFLAYSIIDAVVDNYFLHIEDLGDTLEELEEEVMSEPTDATLQKIHDSRQELMFIRKNIWPLRELISHINRMDSKIFPDDMDIYLRDLHDHIVQIIDTLDTFRDMLGNMLDVYLTSVNNKMNSVMKVLTVIATVFIPLTFVTGIYGMNFEYMPELAHPLGYPVVIGGMLLVGIGMFIYFKKKRWL